MKRLWVLCIVAMGVLPGCFYPSERGRALEARVDKLSSDNEALAAQLKDTNEKLASTLPRVDQKIAEVSQALESLDKASRRSGADIGIQLQKTVEDVAQLRGEVDTYLHRITELENNLKQVQDETNQKLTSMQGAQAKAEADAKKKADELARPSDPKKFLALAGDKLSGPDKDPAVARQLYAEFLKKWPKDEGVAEAHFGLGQAYRAEDRCREALAEYGKVIQDYAKSKMAPDAYLHSSECFKGLGMADESKLALEEVVKSYPKSDAAKTAKTRLVELEKAKKSAKPAPKAAPKKGGKK